jgi:hypothetical protein
MFIWIESVQALFYPPYPYLNQTLGNSLNPVTQSDPSPIPPLKVQPSSPQEQLRDRIEEPIVRDGEEK